MQNCLILGSGRSGTSLTAGLLAGAGYHCGANLMTSREANPSGFFEDHLVNWVNERIMAPRIRPNWFGRRAWLPGQLWLAALDAPTEWEPEEAVRWVIRQLVAHRPFAYKDPRLSYTLNAWRPHLDGCRFVCVFRDPQVTAASIAKEIAGEAYYGNLRIDAAAALRTWVAMYTQILDFHCTDDAQWLFIDYEQLISRQALEPLGRFLGVQIDDGLLDANLNRSRADGVSASDAASELYERLLRKAGSTQAAVR